MHQLPVSYFDQIPAGKVVARITNDTEVLRSNFYVIVISNLMSNIIQIIGAFLALFFLNHTLGLAMLILIPILGIWQHMSIRSMLPVIILPCGNIFLKSVVS